ncbi:ProQ/FinO family protein (plasmid) [Photobacterium sp. CCB-ST2H9]|uniref:ProQ/FINO family protein n=1 Tax=Photobacterium sp. CCB-ST2H9 TaxID=2912855 RepID=UPI0020052E50|nr:ProQ/FINO family protein [Photobacterium sp. CCB-ST2H9]UTM60471.1 ProQ/FinO family protein [Photobacterium sp. CCB-ST2H9]
MSEKRATLKLNATTKRKPGKPGRIAGKSIIYAEPVKQRRRTPAVAPSKLVEQQQKHVRKLKDASAQSWLQETFPHLFGAKPVALCLNIHSDIYRVHRCSGGTNALGFGWNPLSRALKKWTRKPGYLRVVSAPGSMRYGIDGSPVELVSDDHRDYAKDTLHGLNRKKG